MVTLTLKINDKTEKGKSIIKFIKASTKESKVMEIIEEKSPFHPDFGKKS